MAVTGRHRFTLHGAATYFASLALAFGLIRLSWQHGIDLSYSILILGLVGGGGVGRAVSNDAQGAVGGTLIGAAVIVALAAVYAVLAFPSPN